MDFMDKVTELSKKAYEGTEKANDIFASHAEEIGGEVLAIEFIKGASTGYTK